MNLRPVRVPGIEVLNEYVHSLIGHLVYNSYQSHPDRYSTYYEFTYDGISYRLRWLDGEVLIYSGLVNYCDRLAIADPQFETKLIRLIGITQ